MMADAEVTVSSGQVMMVKKDEEEFSRNNQRTQVFLQHHGLNYDTTGTGTTVQAVKTHPEKKNERKAGGEDTEYGYPITCGDSRGVLLIRKFVCPGINVRCVRFNEQLISPKQFVNLAGKATLKDWKRAIRLGGVMLRKMMDSGQIDFYQHDSVCSNTCRSTKSDVLLSGPLPPPGTSVQPGLSCLAPDPAGRRELPVTEMHNVREGKESSEDSFRATAERTNGPQQLGNPTTDNRYSARIKRADMPEEVLSLWSGVLDAGLMGAVLFGLQNKLVTTLRGVELRSETAVLQETDVFLLHSLCEMFGLLDSVKQAVDLQCSQNVVPDQILTDQRRQSCNKSRACKTPSLKPLRSHRQSQPRRRNKNLLSAAKRSTVICPLPVNGLATASHSLFFTYPAAFAAQSHLAGGGKADGDDRGGDEEKDTAGMHKKTNQRRVHLPGGSYPRGEELTETETSHHAEKIVREKKTTKKQESNN